MKLSILKKATSILFVVAMLLSVSIPSVTAKAYAADSDIMWKTLYRNEIKRVLEEEATTRMDPSDLLMTAALIDIDIDGTPELFIGYPPGSMGTWFYDYYYTVKNGMLINLELNKNSGEESVLGIGSSELHYNPSTGGTRVVTQSGARWGAYEEWGYLMTTTLTNTNINQATLFGTHCLYDPNDEKLISDDYTVQGIEVPKSKYNTAVEQWYKGWVKVPSFVVSEAYYLTPDNEKEITDLINNYNISLTKAQASRANITINNNKKNCVLYNIGGNNYIKLRDIAALLNNTNKSFSVGWSQSDKTISLQSGKAYVPTGGELSLGNGVDMIGQKATISIKLNSTPLQLTAYNIDGNNYIKLRDIAEAINFGVGWDDSNKTILIDTTTNYSK